MDTDRKIEHVGNYPIDTTNCTNSEHIVDTQNWDLYFYQLALAASMKSPCLSRKIGAVLVKDKSVIATGFNGPPRGVPHCGKERDEKDEGLKRIYRMAGEDLMGDSKSSQCPRVRLGFRTGEGLHLCSAAHAERNCIMNAARLGVPVKDSALYITCGIPCKDCLGEIINSGIKEVIATSWIKYDKQTDYILKNSRLMARLYNFISRESEPTPSP